jgi:hypothetical protein
MKSSILMTFFPVCAIFDLEVVVVVIDVATARLKLVGCRGTFLHSFGLIRNE